MCIRDRSIAVLCKLCVTPSVTTPYKKETTQTQPLTHTCIQTLGTKILANPYHQALRPPSASLPHPTHGRQLGFFGNGPCDSHREGGQPEPRVRPGEPAKAWDRHSASPATALAIVKGGNHFSSLDAARWWSPGARHSLGPVSYTHLTLPTILLV